MMNSLIALFVRVEINKWSRNTQSISICLWWPLSYIYALVAIPVSIMLLASKEQTFKQISDGINEGFKLTLYPFGFYEIKDK